MKFVIITGMSGAGKSEAIKCFEDLGYYCVDNMPPVLFGKFAEICASADTNFKQVAFGIDTRGGAMFNELEQTLEEFERTNGKCDILFLDADNEILVKRYKESRRKHPLSVDGSLTEGIKKEREMLKSIRKRAKYVVNTSNMKPRQLRDYIVSTFDTTNNPLNVMTANIMSFGFKYGIPIDADIVLDVRFLPNPFYVPELKEKTGLDREVSDYVKNAPVTQKFLGKLTDMFTFLMPHYIEEGKTNLIVAIGCTGGKHRSVTVANYLGDYLANNGYNIFINHRDINKDRISRQ